jgi:hypothetical protein
MDFTALVEAQRQFFNSGATQDLEVRRAALIALKGVLRDNEAEIAAALQTEAVSLHAFSGKMRRKGTFENSLYIA